jgi:hypothetical protein
VRRRHVLPRRVDDQLLLAVDDLHEPVLVDRPDVSGMQPTVGVDCLYGLFGIVAVALHDVCAPNEQLAVVGNLDLGPRHDLPDSSDADISRTVDRGDGGQFGHTPRFAYHDSETEHEKMHLGRNRSRARRTDPNVVQPKLRPHSREHEAFGSCVLQFQRKRHGLPIGFAARLLLPDVQCPTC